MNNKLRSLLKQVESQPPHEGGAGTFIPLNDPQAKNMRGMIGGSDGSCRNNEGCSNNRVCSNNMNCSGNNTCTSVPDDDVDAVG